MVVLFLWSLCGLRELKLIHLPSESALFEVFCSMVLVGAMSVIQPTIDLMPVHIHRASHHQPVYMVGSTSYPTPA